jgi:Uma2 family endonuclease
VITVARYFQIEKDPRYETVFFELIGGELILSPPRFLTHQRVLLSLLLAVHAHVEARRLGEIVHDLATIFGPIDCVRPDAVFVRRTRSAILDPYCHGAPDLIIEVLSPGLRRRDLDVKRQLYECNGVAHYWIVDIEDRELIELVLERGVYVERSRVPATGRFAPAIFPKLSLDLRKIFP